MKIIGITGKSGSGKSYFAVQLTKKLNCPYVDIDKIGHEATSDEEILKKLCQNFGKQILNDDGSVNKKKLGSIVFSSKSDMDILTALTWKYMKAKLDNLTSKDHNYIVLDWALLPISDYWNKCDYKILITSDYSLRKDAVLKRDNITSDYFDKRESSSVDYSSIKFDYTFENNYTSEFIEKSINLIYESLI